MCSFIRSATVTWHATYSEKSDVRLHAHNDAIRRRKPRVRSLSSSLLTIISSFSFSTTPGLIAEEPLLRQAHEQEQAPCCGGPACGKSGRANVIAQQFTPQQNQTKGEQLPANSEKNQHIQ